MGEPSLFGQRLKRFRLRKGLSQSALARQSGVARATIAWLETGVQGSLSSDRLVKLADVLGCSTDMLLRGDVLEEDEDKEMRAATV